MKKVYILGNGKSLGEIDLSRLKHATTIGCNYIYKSGFTPTYYCITDVNFFNHCTFDIFSLPTIFVLSRHFYNLHKDRAFGKRVMVVDFSDVPFLETTDYDLNFKKISGTGGTLTNFAFPLAVFLLENKGVIRLLGIDHDNEQRHFYDEEKDLDWFMVALDVTKKDTDTSHSPFIKEQIRTEFEHTKKLVEKRGISIVNCSSDVSKLAGIKRKQLSWLQIKDVVSKQ